MNASPTIGKLATALAKAQATMQAATLDGTNPHFKSKFATLASTWAACRDALSANELAVVQPTRIDENGIVVLCTTMIHSSGEWISSEYPVSPERGNTPQAIGSALTYARRYTLAALVGVVADDDDDGNAASQGKPAPQRQPRRPATIPGGDLGLPDRMEDYGPPLDYDNLFTGNGLSKAAAGFVEKCRVYHAESEGPCTEPMYRYLVGIVNFATEKDAHSAILAELVGRPVDGDNRPGYTLTKKLLDTLPATKRNKETKEDEPNPDHVPAILAAVREIWQATKVAA